MLTMLKKNFPDKSFDDYITRLLLLSWKTQFATAIKYPFKTQSSFFAHLTTQWAKIFPLQFINVNIADQVIMPALMSEIEGSNPNEDFSKMFVLFKLQGKD